MEALTIPISLLAGSLIVLIGTFCGTMITRARTDTPGDRAVARELTLQKLATAKLLRAVREDAQAGDGFDPDVFTAYEDACATIGVKLIPIGVETFKGVPTIEERIAELEAESKA